MIISSNNKNSNINKFPSFQKIYRVTIANEVVRNCNEKDIRKKIIDTILDVFTEKTSKIRNNCKDGCEDSFHKMLNVCKEYKAKLYNESPLFETFEMLKDVTNNASWWLARHLRIEEPQRFSQNHSTYLLYTGEESAQIQRKETKINLWKRNMQINNRIKEMHNNRDIHKPSDVILWKEILRAMQTEEIIKNISLNKGIEKIEIKEINDWNILSKKLDELISID